jgi:hypothetical protein
MKYSLLAALVVMGTTRASLAPVASAAPVQASAPRPLVCDNTASTPATGTYSSVRVPAGASCHLENATVTGNLIARNARNVYVINTDVRRNIEIRGTRRDVKIGPRGCRFDPPVGNNILVTRSHNVAICFMTVGNNITVSRNDGRLMVRRNVVGSNLRVVDNLAYDRRPGDGRHRLIDAVRVRRNEAGRHIVVRRNADRPLLLAHNVPEPTT